MTHFNQALVGCFLGSLSFCLRHRGLERDLKDLGCFLQLLFLCIEHENGIIIIEDIGCTQFAPAKDTFRSSKVSSLNVVLQSEN